MNQSNNHSRQLTQHQKKAVLKLFSQGIKNVKNMEALLNDPDELLIGLGSIESKVVEDKDIAEISEFFYHFKPKLRRIVNSNNAPDTTECNSSLSENLQEKVLNLFKNIFSDKQVMETFLKDPATFLKNPDTLSQSNRMTDEEIHQFEKYCLHFREQLRESLNNYDPW